MGPQCFKGPDGYDDRQGLANWKCICGRGPSIDHQVNGFCYYKEGYKQAIEDAAKVAELPIVNFSGREMEACYECDCHGECPQEWYPKKIRALLEGK